ncbi:formate--tetrahydrofolate ligase [Cardiobacteriaceae bacterium TAE3-ERU3]|nr:formate--tetrahydrofolate ligase [Cardiobacteriaceae bacterium TAE3-ERU3]
MNDADIAYAAQLQPITDIAATLGIEQKDLIPYGHHIAKLTPPTPFTKAPSNHKLILVTATNPTPAGEGKTTVTIGLADALRQLGKNAAIAIREPSLGPVFGIKGGAAGGGYAQVLPMEAINLHFTGDIHAISAANNLLAAMIDNHIHHGNALNIDPKRITWRRAVDMNDRQLRQIISGAGGTADGVTRPDGFDITVASEVMAIFCLAEDLTDLQQRLGNILIGYTRDQQPVYARDLNAHGAMAALLKDALKPNLVQTIEGTPAFVHGGPFANIAHGCNSVIATKTAMHFADYTVTEAGFGADLGAEKFCDIKCRQAGIAPDCAVIVTTIRALKYNGGKAKNELNDEDTSALENGLPNLRRHIENMQRFGVPVVVAINRFSSDSDAELQTVKQSCAEAGVSVAFCDVWAEGGKGGKALAEAVLEALQNPAQFAPIYDNELSLTDKISTIAQKVYRAKDVAFSKAAQQSLAKLEELGFSDLPVCIAKNQYSFSDDPSQLGAPEGFTLHIENAQVSAGAGFVVAIAGNIMKMPGLPKSPAAERISVDEEGRITGLF